MSSVFLIGSMGCGKSTIGTALAARLGRRYIDNDEQIARLAGTSTVQLALGPPGLLHDWECRYVHAISAADQDAIYGVAASTADRPDDLRLLRASGILVHLHVPPAELARRVAGGPARPWLSADPGPLLAAQYRRRSPILTAAAQHTVDAGRPIAVVVDEVVSAVAAHGAGTEQT